MKIVQSTCRKASKWHGHNVDMMTDYADVKTYLSLRFLQKSLVPNSQLIAQMYLSWYRYLLRESSEWSRYSTVSVPPKPGTLMSTPGELSVVLVLLSYSNLKQTLKQGFR